MLDEELALLFENRIATRLAKFSQDRGFKTIDELREFVAGTNTKRRDKETLSVLPHLSDTYESANWIELLRIPGMGRKSVNVVVKWACAPAYKHLEKLMGQLATANAKVEAAKQNVREIKRSISDLRRSLL